MEHHLELCSQCIDHLDSIKGDTLGDRLLTVGPYLNQRSETESDEVPPALLNHARYEIIERIGGGGMGDVYQARQRSMDRFVAIKVLRQSLFENDRAVARFHNEIKIAASLNHPNIVHSYDADLSNGLHILIMELVDGSKLSDVVASEGPLSPCQACQIAVEIAKGLEYANAKGMIHRDIKPQNIMILPDRSVKITDFGLAKFMLGSIERTDGSLTSEGEVFGTPDYIAPEQIRDASNADRRSDIYSLGCTLYFMLTGRPPFANLSIGEKLAGHLEKDPPMLEEIRPNIPASLAQVVHRMMHKVPGQRPQSYEEVIQAIQHFCDSDFIDAGPMTVAPFLSPAETAIDIPPPSPVSSRTPINRRHMIAIAAMGLLVLGGLSWAWGILPNPFETRMANPRNGKIRIAIVIPSVNAYFPEVQGFYRQTSRRDDVEIEFLAEKTGKVSFYRQLAGAPRKIQIQRTLANASPDEFDAVIFTGAWDGQIPDDTKYAFDARFNRQAKQFCKKFLNQGKPIGGVCGGTAVLAKTGLLKGIQVANCRYLSQQLRDDSGAIWTEIPAEDNLAKTVVDGQFVTGGNAINCREVFEAALKIARESRN